MVNGIMDKLRAIKPKIGLTLIGMDFCSGPGLSGVAAIFG
jgi:hypothetical protein